MQGNRFEAALVVTTSHLPVYDSVARLGRGYGGPSKHALRGRRRPLVAAPVIVGVFAAHRGAGEPSLRLPATFQTDLNDFSPETDASEARPHPRSFPDEMRPLFVHVAMDNLTNVLDLEALKAMQEDLTHFQTEADKRENMVTFGPAPGILQLAIDEEGGGAPLASFATWSDVLDALFDDNETCGLTADDQLLFCRHLRLLCAAAQRPRLRTGVRILERWNGHRRTHGFLNAVGARG